MHIPNQLKKRAKKKKKKTEQQQIKELFGSNSIITITMGTINWVIVMGSDENPTSILVTL